MFPAIIATRGNAIIAAILQWNTFCNKRIWHHPTYVQSMKIVIHYLASIVMIVDNIYLSQQTISIACDMWRCSAIYCICDTIDM